MTSPEEIIRTELARVISRLETMPVTRIDESVGSLVHSAAELIIALTLDPDRPPESTMPSLGSAALAAQLTVVTRDYLEMRTAASEDAAVAKVLIDLRRSLP